MKRSVPATNEPLQNYLERVHARFHRRACVGGDPLGLLYRYEEDRDREIAGLVAALLAYGAAPQIIRSAAWVLDRMGPSPAAFLLNTPPRAIAARMKGFRHRWTTGRDVADVLVGARGLLQRFGSMERSFLAGLRPEDEDVRPALRAWVGALRRAAGGRLCRLMPDPEKGSACKRWHLFLRWMARRDEVDPGVWPGLSPAQLLAPLDVHMARAARRLGLTRRRSADEKMVLEVTTAFRRWRPDDPVRWDFALTREAMARAAGEKRESAERRRLTSRKGFVKSIPVKSSPNVASNRFKPARPL